uniref:Uncharacterized protein n=1 Tax=Brassica oleracea TaxID=3712 RepID=A0A3P6CGN2_BRAOL|nr:unnamed protein product [Brassica oleracea]
MKKKIIMNGKLMGEQLRDTLLEKYTLTFDRKDLQCRGTTSSGIRKVSQDIASSLGYLCLTDARREIELLDGDSNPLRCAFSVTQLLNHAITCILIVLSLGESGVYCHLDAILIRNAIGAE